VSTWGGSWGQAWGNAWGATQRAAVAVFGGGWLRRRAEQRKREYVAMKYAMMAVGGGLVR